MSRYNGKRVLNNTSEFYRFLRQMRHNQKNIRHYGTPILKNPGLIERAAIATNAHIWTTGDHFYKIAAQYYNDSKYWWVIAWYNGFPTEGDITLGTIIDIPINLEKALIALGL